MKTEIKKNLFNLKTIIVLLLVVFAVHAFVNKITSDKFTEIEHTTEVQIANQQTLLTAIAEKTAVNGADAITEKIIKDCSLAERNSFDELLGSLNKGLTYTQLGELERLFGRCGSFYSQRKSVMVSRLDREIEIFEHYVNQLSLITGEDKVLEYKLDSWKDLVEAEKKQSELFSELVTLQDEIITTLISGSTVSSLEITEILQQVKEVKETLSVVTQQTSKLRMELITI